MAEHFEGAPDRSEQEGKKVENLHQLRDLMNDKLGYCASFFVGSLNRIAGYEAPTSMSVNSDAESKRLEGLLEGAKITPEIINQINEAIVIRVKKMEDELEAVKDRKGMENYIESCKDIISKLENKRLILSEDRVVSFE